MYEYNATVIRVIDGDSVWLEVDVGFHMTYKYNFRLGGINTPELRSSDPEEKARAYAAKARLEELLPVGQQVKIKTAKPGKYGRWIADVFLNFDEPDGVFINQTLLAEGHAVPY
jgi:micrococcal nuclease